MKKRLIFVYFIVIMGLTAHAQTILTSLPNKIAYPASQVTIPVQVQNFSGVASLSLTLDYLPASLVYQSYQNAHPALAAGSMFVNVQPGPSTDRMIISWFSLTPANVGNGVLFELLFSYAGGSSPLTWDTLTWGNCQYTDLDGNELQALFVSGSVSPIQPNTTSLPEVFGVPGNTLEVPVTVNSFQGVAWMHLSCQFDPAVVDYQSFTNAHPDLSAGTLAVNESNGLLTIDWSSAVEANLGDDTMLVLVFDYLNGASALSWDTLTPGACLYKDINGTAMPAIFIDGSVNSSLVQLSITSVSLCNGSAVNLSVNASNVHDMASFSLRLDYDTLVLKNIAFQNLHPDLAAGSFNLLAQGNGALITWNSSQPVNFATANLFDLTFTSPLTGGGYSNMSWQSQLSTFTNSSGSSIPCNYVGGTVSITPFINLGPDQLVCIYHSASLYAGANFASYLWSTGDTTPTILVDSSMGAGTYSVTVTDVLGCQGYDQVQVAFDPCFSVEEVNQEIISMNAFPNPSTNGIYRIELNTKAGVYSLLVADILGKQIQVSDIKSSGGKWAMEVDLHAESPGLYLLYLSGSQDYKHLKLVRQ